MEQLSICRATSGYHLQDGCVLEVVQQLPDPPVGSEWEGFSQDADVLFRVLTHFIPGGTLDRLVDKMLNYWDRNDMLTQVLGPERCRKIREGEVT